MDNKDMGVTLELSHEILKGDGEAFLRALSFGEKIHWSFTAGAAWRW